MAYKLMIVDDSNVIRNKIERDIGAHAQFDVVATAADGVAALDLFRQRQPEVVTMDITMPHMDGLACIREMMAINPKVNILVVSALSDEYTGLLALQHGARGFVYKPFNTETLTEALLKMMASAA